MYNKKWFFSLIAPSLIVFSIVMLIPTLVGITLSFTNWKMGEELFQGGWTGFSNYKKAFQDGTFTTSIWYTSLFTIVCILLVNFIGFGLALMLNKAFRGKNIFRSAFFVPNLIGGLILGYIWRLIIDEISKGMGIQTIRLSSQWGAMLSMAVVVAWQMAGYVMIIYLAALQNVNKSLSEASKIEGAGKWTTFKTVIIPTVAPAVTVSVFLVLSGSFKMFDQNLSLTEGTNGSGLLAFNIYQSAFNEAYRHTYGIAQAKAFIFTILVSAIAIIQVHMSKKMEIEQ